MTRLKTKVANGRIELSAPPDWPDGTEVLVEPVAKPQRPNYQDEDWATDPESIAAWIAEFEAIPPLEMTPEEEAEWQAARKAQREFELSHWEERASSIEKLFP